MGAMSDLGQPLPGIHMYPLAWCNTDAKNQWNLLTTSIMDERTVKNRCARWMAPVGGVWRSPASPTAHAVGLAAAVALVAVAAVAVTWPATTAAR